MKIEQAKQLTEQALDQLIQALEAGKSQALLTYLATMSRFPEYSWFVPLNISKTMLIAGLCESGGIPVRIQLTVLAC
jgi:hypothetical protein